MTTHHDEADGPTLQVVLDAVLQRNDAFERLGLILTENTNELRRTQELLDTRPTKEDVAYHRRRGFATVILVAFMVIFAHDQHVENCGPGARAESAVVALINDADREAIEEAARGKAAPQFCDMTFPLHTHDDDGWPSKVNLLGMGLYGAFAAAVTSWVLVAYRRMKRVEAAEKRVQPRNRRTGDRDPIDPSQAL